MSSAQLEFVRTQLADPSLLELAASGLEPMFDRERQLFCFTLRLGKQGMIREGAFPRYTMMTLLGLDRWQEVAHRSFIELSLVLDRLISNPSWLDCLGDLGLLLWSCALLDPERLPEVATGTQIRSALDRFPDGRECRTMELAWFLTGLCYSLRTRLAAVADLEPVAERTYRLINQNQGKRGIFGHLARTRSLAGLLRGSVGSFADQVYPIYALARYGELTGKREALERASACANRICELQGPLGEWWWHYDARNGDVVETYPVYSVHQDGMAPMALLALSDVTGQDFSTPIRKGLAWITGHNELGYDMRSTSPNLIWRNLQLPRREQYLRRLVPSRQDAPTPAHMLAVNRECRPYELGWALYALAGWTV